MNQHRPEDISYTRALHAKYQEGKLRVCSIGAGYVGSLTSLVLAALNPTITVEVCDVNVELIRKWKEQRYPFFEPQIEEYYEKSVFGNKNLFFTDDVATCIKNSDVIFICVNTPPKEISPPGMQGKEADMTYFMKACETIGASSDPTHHRILIEKSTVPVGTQHQIMEVLKRHSSNPDECFTIVSSPEFLAEGTAIHNLVHPDRVVIGTPPGQNGLDAFDLVKELYKNQNTTVVHTRTASSELGKLMANAMLAQRISSMNSITELCEKSGASIMDVKQILGTDKRIGPYFLQCSPGFGGSCFEKDIQSLVYILESNGCLEAAQFWNSVLTINYHQKQRLADMISNHFVNPQATTLSVFGYSYKKNTSDTRSTPVAFLVNDLVQKGFQVNITDPRVSESHFHMEMQYQGYDISRNGNFKFCGPDMKTAAKDSSAIIIMTEWDEYLECDYKEIRNLMNAETGYLFDLRCFIDFDKATAGGFNKVFILGK